MQVNHSVTELTLFLLLLNHTREQRAESTLLVFWNAEDTLVHTDLWPCIRYFHFSFELHIELCLFCIEE